MSIDRVPVLVVGGGLAGMSAALFLAYHGVASVLAERHRTTSIHPKARGQTPQTMEALRIAGIAEAAIAAGPSGDSRLHITIAESVVGRTLHTIVEDALDLSHLSPGGSAMASQERMELILADRATELGAQIRFSTRMEGLTQDAEGVTATLRDTITGQVQTVRADYLIAADGHRSPIRTALGIGTHGRGSLNHYMMWLFEAELGHLIDETTVTLYYLQNPALHGGNGALVTTDHPGRYALAAEYHPDRGEKPGDFTSERATEQIRTAIGIPDLPVRILHSDETEFAARVADRFSAGRVHLIGDAAHVMPPTGGQGGNMALMDGFYLAWKLAMVVKGAAGPGLLASHDAERRPIAELLVEQQYANLVHRMAPHLADGSEAAPVDPAALFLGYRYPSGAIVSEPGDDGSLLEDPSAPTGCPGSRAPHVPLVRDGMPISTIDLFGSSFVLLTGSRGQRWRPAADEVAHRLGMQLAVHQIGADGLADPTGTWAHRYHVTDSDAVLIRPDRSIAWRSTEHDNPAQSMETALRHVLDR
ncbi:MAG: FAD-dependent monooxygenase [Pseudonocardiaceae bacterium]